MAAQAGLSMSMLQGMIDSGMASVTTHVVFEEPTLGMCLADAPPGGAGGVEVRAFTERDGQPGAAELSGNPA